MTTRAASPEAFTTYGNYLRAWKYALQQMAVVPVAFGADPANPIGLTQGRSAQVAACLHRYWGNLRALEILNTSGIAAEVLTVHPPIAYYAAHNASRAYLFSRNLHAADIHRGVLNQMAQECQHTHLPAPWSAYCEGAPADRLFKFSAKSSGLRPISKTSTSATQLALWPGASAPRDEMRWGSGSKRHAGTGRRRLREREHRSNRT